MLWGNLAQYILLSEDKFAFLQEQLEWQNNLGAAEIWAKSNCNSEGAISNVLKSIPFIFNFLSTTNLQTLGRNSGNWQQCEFCCFLFLSVILFSSSKNSAH